MKKRPYVTLFLTGTLLLTVFPPAGAQEINRRIFSQGAGREILIGLCNREGMEQEPFVTWFDREYSSYQPDESIIKTMEDAGLPEVNVTIVLGTWCPDSRREVPRFYKVADILNIPDDHIKVICVDRDKTAPVPELPGLGIERVPTFIFYLSGKETGRIVESPGISLEADMKNILIKK